MGGSPSVVRQTELAALRSAGVWNNAVDFAENERSLIAGVIDA